MGVGDDFRTLYTNSGIGTVSRSTISDRYQLITRRSNLEYWDTDSRVAHSFYTGSYGRNTASSVISDVDMILQLPYSKYTQYRDYKGNGASALLQEVSRAIQKTYPGSAVGADGQVVVIAFNDGIVFEVQPAFENTDGSYTFPNSNNGGSWPSTNPKPEIAEIDRLDGECNGNVKALARIMRAWKARWDVPIGGLLVDTLVYSFMRTHENKDKSFVYYDYVSRDFFNYMRNQDANQDYWLSPGANQRVWRKGSFEYKALRCFNIATEACNYQGDNYGWTARQKWREIFGAEFPAG